MKKFALIAVVLFAGAQAVNAKAVIKGSGGMVTDGKTRTYCPKESNSTCATITNVADPQSSALAPIGSEVIVEDAGGQVIDNGIVVGYGQTGSVTIQDDDIE